MRANEFITEAGTYQAPKLSVGDEILKGKFKNSPAEIKGFTKDKHNQPVLKTNKGEVQLFKPRISKLMKEGVGSTTTLTQLYGGNFPDRDETFWDYVSNSELNKPLTVQTMQRHLVKIMLLSQYRAEDIEDITDMLDDEQQAIVAAYENDPALSSKVIVIADDRIIDGNHRALAAAIKGVPINYVDLSELDGDEEVVDEMAGSIHGGVRKVLKDKGYKYIGSGIDKQAWLEPGTGQVLIIFGYRKGFKDFSPDQRMFIDWITYCNKNANNPHLPKFSGFESFEFQGNNYIQARMEPLKDIPVDTTLKSKLPWLDEYIRAKKEINVSKVATELGQYWQRMKDPATGKIVSREQTAEEVIDAFGGAAAAEQLMRTVQQVKQFGKQHGFSLDLHGGNYMLRADGTIVVNDPFVVWLH